MTDLPTRRQVSIQLRRAYKLWEWLSELNKIDGLKQLGKGRRAFLLGSGPSLLSCDLGLLGGEFVCVVNRGLRALDGQLPHADMHVVNDIHCYKTFGAEIEDVAARHSIPHRFLNLRMRSRWKKFTKSALRPIFLVGNSEKLERGRRVPALTHGIVTGPSVLLSAAVLLKTMGFKEIYILGCDLDYDTAGAYFYPLDAADKRHEIDPDVQARRKNMLLTDAGFEILRQDFEREGVMLYNAGVGGNLNALRRVDFASLFRIPNVAKHVPRGKNPLDVFKLAAHTSG